MVQDRCHLIGGVIAFALLLAFASPRVVEAHEHRSVGAYDLAVGWADEPTFVGFKNAVQVLLKDASGKPITDLGDTLKVEVISGKAKMGPVPLERAFGRTFGTPGDYRAPIIPTRPGTYTFHFTGTIKDQPVDLSLTSSEKTFDSVSDAAEIEFPIKDPSRAELAERLERLGPRVDTTMQTAGEAKTAAGQDRVLAIGGVLLGVIGIGVGSAAVRRRGAA